MLTVDLDCKEEGGFLEPTTVYINVNLPKT